MNYTNPNNAYLNALCAKYELLSEALKLAFDIVIDEEREKTTRDANGVISSVWVKFPKIQRQSTANIELAAQLLPSIYSQMGNSEIVQLWEELKNDRHIRQRIALLCEMHKRAQSLCASQILSVLKSCYHYNTSKKIDAERTAETAVFEALYSRFIQIAPNTEISTFGEIIKILCGKDGKRQSTFLKLFRTRIDEYWKYCEAKASTMPADEDGGYSGRKFVGKYYRLGLGYLEKDCILHVLGLNGFLCTANKSGHKTLNITVKGAPEKHRYNLDLGEFYPDSPKHNPKDFKARKELEKTVKSIAEQFDMDDSDAMTDYFCSHMYISVEIDAKCVFADKKAKTEKQPIPANKEKATTGAATHTQGEQTTFTQTNEVNGEKWTFELKDKYFVLGGDTYKYKEEIKNFFGGKWNKAAGGWMIFNEHLENCKMLFS